MKYRRNKMLATPMTRILVLDKKESNVFIENIILKIYVYNDVN